MPEDRHRLGRRGVAGIRGIVLLAAIAPFLPGACEIVRHGVPDRILTADRAILELRTLNAAHGAQLVGPYSRFGWSQPGPAYFYLALPFYEALHGRGPALSVFAFTVNLVSAIFLVLTARRLKGETFAIIVAVMLAVYGTGAPRFHLAEMWNPILPALPLGLLFFLAVRLGVGELRVLPAIALMASCIVQTHLAYAPVTVAVCAAAISLCVRRLIEQRRSSSSRVEPPAHPLLGWALTIAVLVLLWAAPLYQELRSPEGNLRALLKFFSAPPVTRQPWSSVMEVVAQHLAVLPFAFVRLLNPSREAPTGPVVYWLAAALVLGLIAALVSTSKRDPVSKGMATLALVGIATSMIAIKEVRGPILPYFVMWISMVGLFASSAVVAAFLPRFTQLSQRRAVLATFALAGALCVGFSVRAQATDSVFPERDPDAEVVIPAIRQFLRGKQVENPILVVTNRPHPWPVATAVPLDLYKHGIPFLVDEGWRFMMGHQFELDGSPHPHLYIGDGAFDRFASTRPDLIPVARASDTGVYLEDPAYLRAHQISGPAVLVRAAGTAGDPRVATDGFIPVESSAWDGPWSVILESKDSFLEVAVPRRRLIGLYLSVAGDDGYAVSCLRPDGSFAPLGTTSPDERESGMRTRLVFSDALATCSAIRIGPREDGGKHSIGEVGFLGG
jgi:hypothetical protein